MSRRNKHWESDGVHPRRGSYEDYDHSDQEVYVYDQCCKNCRYYYNDGYAVQCLISGSEDEQFPAEDGSSWCEDWRGGQY